MSNNSFGLLVAAAALGLVGVVGLAVSVMENRRRALMGAGLAPRKRLPSHVPGLGLGEWLRPKSWPALLTMADIEAMSTYMKLAPDSITEAGFQPLGRPGPGDWRAGPGRLERHQDFAGYRRFQLPESKLLPRILVLRPVGVWPRRYRRFMPAFQRLMSIFFQRPVRWGKPLRLGNAFVKRVRSEQSKQWVQYWTRPILDSLKENVPHNAVAVLGITVEDLYPDEQWNYVFGEAYLDFRVGVYSLNRLFSEPKARIWTPEEIRRNLMRAFKVLTHETGHMLGIQHCIVHRCGMNGCNNLEELDRSPFHFCPLCMAKMAWKLGLDVRRRYRELNEFMSFWGYSNQASFYIHQVSRLDRQKAPRSYPCTGSGLQDRNTKNLASTAALMDKTPLRASRRAGPPPIPMNARRRAGRTWSIPTGHTAAGLKAHP